MKEQARPLLEINDLKTWFPLRRGLLNRTYAHVRAVDGVSLSLFRGQTLGLVGESGCGKTTLGRTILGLEKPSSGRMEFDGVALETLSRTPDWRKRIQMIFQDPHSSLNPRMVVMDILTEGMVRHGLLKKSREQTAKELLAEVGMDSAAIYRYAHEFSGGQRQRISIARALSLRAELIVCDEAVSALDVSVQAQVLTLLNSLRKKYGLSYLFISHDLAVVGWIADHVAVMYLGHIMEAGPVDEVLFSPLHPYTKALLSAVPHPGKTVKQRILLKGDPPSPLNPPAGCRFHTRCPEAMAICGTNDPENKHIKKSRVRCHLY